MDNIYIKRCFQLAKRGAGNTHPNPIVGCVIVYNGKIIGEGFHRKCGTAHAEVNAINSVKDKSLLSKSTLYVSLEPCAHQGRTPACSDLIIRKKIPNVVIACLDIYEKVSGKGIKMMQKAGINVKIGILQKEAIELNRRFFTFYTKKRPYIILKWARTTDNFIDIIRTQDTPIQPNWITDEYARILVHKWRSEEPAIMIGTNTAEKDNPKLNVRYGSGTNPIRIVLDRILRLPENLNLFNGSQKTIIFTEKQKENKKICEYVKIKFDNKLMINIFEYLYKRNIQSIIIEGGAKLLNSLIKDNLWDEARVFVGEKMFYDGIKSPVMKVKHYKIETLSNSKLYYFRNII